MNQQNKTHRLLGARGKRDISISFFEFSAFITVLSTQKVLKNWLNGWIYIIKSASVEFPKNNACLCVRALHCHLNLCYKMEENERKRETFQISFKELLHNLHPLPFLLKQISERKGMGCCTFITEVIGYLWLLLPSHNICWIELLAFSFWLHSQNCM